MAAIPLCDLKAQYASIREKIVPKVEEVLASSAYINGPFVQSFEKRFLEMHGAKFGGGCSNGTSAIRLALQSLGVGDGDEVIVPSLTFFATVEPIIQLGGRPVFVDISPYTYNMVPEQVEAAITEKTSAIIPVHIHGNPCDMDAIWAIAQKKNLKVIEDCAQAHFAKWKGKYVGTQSDAASFSFYPGKNLGAYGDAGFYFIKTEALYKKARSTMNHGQREGDKYRHETVGDNLRMDALQAAILEVKLDHILDWTRKRQEAAAKYNETLKAKGFKTADVLPDAEMVYHQFIVEVSNREEVMTELKKQEIACQVHYPVPLHLQPALGSLGYHRGDLPESEKICDRIVSLPIFPEIQPAQIERVLSEFLKVARA